MGTPSTTLPPATGVPLIDALTHGARWTFTGDATITWSLSNGFDNAIIVDPTTSSQEIDRILGSFEQFIPIDFQYAGYFDDPSAAFSAGSDINVGVEATPDLFAGDLASAWAQSFYPLVDASGPYTGSEGDVFINIVDNTDNNWDFTPGGVGDFMFMRNIGQALGLKPTFDDGGTGRPTLDQVGISDENLVSEWASIMSFEDSNGFADAPFNPVTPMYLDVIGLQALYGKNEETNAGDTIIPLVQAGVYRTIWDASGNDTLFADVGANGEGWWIFLPDIYYPIVDEYIGFSFSLSASSENNLDWVWLQGDLENVIGSPGNDFITANSLDNFVDGDDGLDIIDGGEGDDILLGGDGLDAIWGGAGDDVIFGGESTDPTNQLEDVDFAVYAKSRENYIIRRIDGSSFEVTDRTGEEGVDTVTEVEGFVFNAPTFDDFENGVPIEASEIIPDIGAPGVNGATSDMNGDGADDLIWRNADTGQVVVWEMEGGRAGGFVQAGRVANDWSKTGVGDFTGDGTDDILWRNVNNGQIVVWEMENGRAASFQQSGSVASDWSVVATGDFDGDGTDDVAWRNADSGGVAVWDMEDGRAVGYPSAGRITANWSVVGAGDFDGDGVDDIAWRNADNGDVFVWDMANGRAVGFPKAGQAAANWLVVGTGDFDGDGTDDIAWRNANNGDVFVWDISNGRAAGYPKAGNASFEWSVVGTGDYDSDGTDDIAWRNVTQDRVVVWSMEASRVDSFQQAGRISDVWESLNMNEDAFLIG